MRFGYIVQDRFPLLSEAQCFMASASGTMLGPKCFLADRCIQVLLRETCWKDHCSHRIFDAIETFSLDLLNPYSQAFVISATGKEPEAFVLLHALLREACANSA